MFQKYFSIWSYFVLLAVWYNKLDAYHAVFNSLLASIGGAYITWYTPKYVRLPYTGVYLRGMYLMILDVLGHHIPLLLSMYLLIKVPRTNTFDSYSSLSVIPHVYNTFVYDPATYNLQQQDILLIRRIHQILFAILVDITTWYRYSIPFHRPYMREDGS